MASRRINTVGGRTRCLVALYLGAGAFVLAHSVNAVVEESLARPVHQVTAEGPIGPPESTSHVSQAMNRQLVRDILSSRLFPLPPESEAARSPGSVPVSSVPPLNIATKILLVGTVMGVKDNERAIIEELSSKKQGLYRISQRIPEVGELVAVQKDRVLFREGSQEEWLELAIVKERAAMKPFPRLAQLTERAVPVPSISPMPQNRSTRRTVDRAQLMQLASNREASLNEARFQPRFSGNGRMDGFLVDGIRQVGVLEKFGLQNDDVLVGVNGVEMRDPRMLWDLFKQLQHERMVRFNVIRQSQPVTLTVEIR